MNSTPGVRYPALDALLDAYHRRLNGRFVFRRDGAERSVILLFRTLLFVNSTDKKDRLELLLATRKLMGKEEILRIARKARGQNLDFMTMVQREGALKDVALVDLMQDRAREILADLVTWGDAEVEVDPFGFRAEPVLPFNLKLIPIIVDALSAHLSIDECQRILGSEDTILELTGREYLAPELTATSQSTLFQAVLSEVDGSKSIVDILQATESEGLQVLKVLTVLLLIGAVRFPRTQEETAPESEEPVAGNVVDELPEMAATQLSREEREALSHIFEGAGNLLEDSQEEDDGELEVLSTEDDSYAEARKADMDSDEYEVAAAVEQDDVEQDDDLDPVEADDVDESETTQVREDFNALLDIDPEQAANLFAVGVELMQRGRVAAALASYQEAIDKDPSNAEYYSALGLAHLEDHPDAPADDAGAMRAFLEAVKLDPTVPRNHYYLGQIYGRRGEAEEAVACYEAACRHDPEYAPARQALEAMQGGDKSDKDQSSGFLRRIFGR